MLILSLLSHQDMDWGRSSCFLFELLGETAPQMFHNASIWLTLVLAAQRYIYICQATRSVPAYKQLLPQPPYAL